MVLSPEIWVYIVQICVEKCVCGWSPGSGQTHLKVGPDGNRFYKDGQGRWVDLQWFYQPSVPKL